MSKINIARNGVNYNSLMQSIRPFVDFDYDLRLKLTRYQRDKIKKYYKLIDELTAHPHQIYRPRKKANLNKVKTFAANPIKGYSGLKVAIVPNSGKRAKIRIKNNEIYTETDHIDERTLLFDQNKLAIDPKGHTNELIKQNKSANRFTVKCGVHEQRLPHSRNLIAKHVYELCEKYHGGEGAKSDYREWLIGLSAYTFKNQDKFDDYMQAKDDKAKAMQKKRKNERLALMRADKKANQVYGLFKKETDRLIKKFDEWQDAFNAQQSMNAKTGGYNYIAKKVKSK